MPEIDKAWLEREKRREKRDLAKQLVWEKALEAVKVMIKIMHDEAAPHNVRLQAATGIADRAGLKPTDKVELSGPDGGPIQTQHDLSAWPDEALALQRKAYELAAAARAGKE
jgi:hypothetical protein